MFVYVYSYVAIYVPYSRLLTWDAISFFVRQNNLMKLISMKISVTNVHVCCSTFCMVIVLHYQCCSQLFSDRTRCGILVL